MIVCTDWKKLKVTLLSNPVTFITKTTFLSKRESKAFPFLRRKGRDGLRVEFSPHIHVASHSVQNCLEGRTDRQIDRQTDEQTGKQTDT